MFWIASAPKIYAVYFNEEWNKKAGSNDLLREQFIIALLVLLFIYLFILGWGGECEINFCEFVKNSLNVNPVRNSPALLSTNKVVLP